MFKKILTLMVLLCFIFNMSVSAAGSFELKVGKEFYTIDKDSHTDGNKKISESIMES